ncbi:MAG TPA: tetratricopeptide repeat protein [Candidatus Limnocylindrales bacterium]|nr:tetratricopeptide repeat protein [Candidatus Limnocylindrales bacterium]
MKYCFQAAVLLLVCSAYGQGVPQGRVAPAGDPAQIVTQSEQMLDARAPQQALNVVQDALRRFPDNEDLELELARIYAYQKQDKLAMQAVQSVLQKHPDSREGKLVLAQLYGYRQAYRLSDAIYRDLLAANPADETAALGLIHNLALQGHRDEARAQLALALAKNPSSLLLQQYSDALQSGSAENPELPRRSFRVQSGSSYFSDSSGNHAVFTSEGMNFELGRNVTTRLRMEETSLWKNGVSPAQVIGGWQEIRWKPSRFFALRTSGGGVRFADDSSRGTYSGDLEVFPFKGLTLSGGYSRFPLIPTFEAAQDDLLAEGWHTRIDYRRYGFNITGSLFLNHLSDGNRGEREFAEAMKWFGHSRISIGAGYAFRHLHMKEQLNNGYFSPGQYHSHLGAGGLRLDLGKHYRGEYIGYLGGERINAGNYSGAGELLLRNEFFVRRWQFEANYSHFQLVQSTAAFHANEVSGSAGYRF